MALNALVDIFATIRKSVRLKGLKYTVSQKSSGLQTLCNFVKS